MRNLTLVGKTALVIGGSKGIGAAIAERFAREGASVVIGFNAGEASARALADRLVADGLSASVAPCDVSDEAQIKAIVAITIQRHRQIDIFSFNAGIIDPMKPIAEVSTSEFDTSIAVNLRGMFLSNREVLAHMLVRGAGGRIINTASIFGKRGWANYGVYCAAKAGVIAMTQAIALEVAKCGITANCICPGATASDMMTYETRYWAEKAGISEEAMTQEWLKLVPIGRFQTPEEQAALAAFLARDEARYITGVAITSAGGMELN